MIFLHLMTAASATRHAELMTVSMAGTLLAAFKPWLLTVINNDQYL